jgi:hypothetical protein
MTFAFHNTTYIVTANYHYFVPTGNPPGDPSKPPNNLVSGSVSASFNFANLVVQPDENTVGKILKWDPDTPANRDTTITYTISSAQKKNCQVIIDIYSTEGNKVYTTTLTQLCPGTYTFTWDGTANQTSYPPSNIAPAGLYTFDIKVQGAGYNDADKLRSEIITVSQTSLDIQEDKYKFGYYFQSSNGSFPSKAEVTVYGPAIDNFKKYWGPEEGPIDLGKWNYVAFEQKTIVVGGRPFYCVLSGLDDELNNKAHIKKPLLEKDITGVSPTAAIFYAYWNNKFTKEGIFVGAEPTDNWKTESPKQALTSGAVGIQNNQSFLRVFSPYWVNGNTICDMLLEATNAKLALDAISEVKVFSYSGHGDGKSLEFRKDLSLQTNPEYITGNNIPANSLHLVVIATCRAPDGIDFPIVKAFVDQGADCGIGVGGVYPGEKKYGESSKGWMLLYTDSLAIWSDLFWEYAAKGKRYLWGIFRKYFTMVKAAEEATKDANERIEKRLGKLKKVEIKKYFVSDDYLGNIK